jgi:glycosyltransferase involved in cell wall biosynthesis
MLPVKRFLLSKVDHYIHHFKDLRAYGEVFGIRLDRSSFVPFKVNLSDHHRLEPRPGGDYVLCFGRSMRDFDTFFTAMESVPYPGAIARPNLIELKRNCAKFTRPLDRLPRNIRLLEDDGSESAQIRILSGAKFLVLPILEGSMAASGISTCLNAMMLGKCVVGSEGPGMTDVFSSGEILSVPPEDPTALARAIRQAWEDDALRTRTAAAGYAYAVGVGGERELYARIIDQVTTWCATRQAETMTPA